MEPNTDTLEHIHYVRGLVEQVAMRLLDRGAVHDKSKLSEPEASAYASLPKKLANITYGTPEYREQLRSIQPAIDHHYAHNSHHIEFHKDGVHGMSLLDLMEMLADWKGAGMRHVNSSMIRSLDIAKSNYDLPPVLVSILHNTIMEMGWYEMDSKELI